MTLFFLRYEIENKSLFPWNDTYVRRKFIDLIWASEYNHDPVNEDHENGVVYYMNNHDNDGFTENTALGTGSVIDFDHELNFPNGE